MIADFFLRSSYFNEIFYNYEEKKLNYKYQDTFFTYFLAKKLAFDSTS